MGKAHGVHSLVRSAERTRHYYYTTCDHSTHSPTTDDVDVVGDTRKKGKTRAINSNRYAYSIAKRQNDSREEQGEQQRRTTSNLHCSFLPAVFFCKNVYGTRLYSYKKHTYVRIIHSCSHKSKEDRFALSQPKNVRPQVS